MKWWKDSVLTLLFSFIVLSCAKENQCRSKANCPEGSTCCQLHSGSYGCCPIKNAICCQDSVHCCPGGYTCDVLKGVCQMGDKSKPLLKKIPAIPTVNEIAEGNVVVCASGEGQCPPDHSCCTVPGSDQVHCCPGGYWCEKGLCRESSIEFPAAVFTSSAAKIVKCNQEFACPDRHTCCKADKSYLCCPLPQAVCCSDYMHCCPRGFKCSPDGKTCSSGTYTLPALSALSPMSLKKGIKKLLHLIMQGAKRRTSPSVERTELTVVKTDNSKEIKRIALLQTSPVSKRKIDLHSVVCPDGASECPDGNTCCKLSSGQWGCCPLPQAVCCSDGVHCCPNGYTCDVSAGTCSQESKTRPILTKLSASKIKVDVDSVVCPDGTSQCPDGDTCCKLSSGEWGCCPLPQAVCCSDGVHCCPHGYTCNVANGTCSQGSRRVPIVTKLPASKIKVDVDSVVCPDGQSQCPDGDTCCKLSSGQWGCCPLPQAVCCSDGVHCCPNGYTCDVSAGTCSQGSKHTAILTKLPASKIKVDVDSVVCPDGTSQCPDGDTCCKLSSGEWGCCPLPQAVCCSDGIHCCPHGYTCNVANGTCSRGSKHTAILTKLSASKIKVDVDSVVCPDGTSQCPDGYTCCKLSSGEWGCCPLPQAVCCSDGVHCCPHGYTCNVANGTCSRGSKHTAILTKLSASKIKVDVESVVCPDGASECPDGNTCCKLSSGQWGCCPLPQAVCCSDGVHCCPNGYTCDVSAGTCSQESKTRPILTKLSASKIKVDVDSVVCPDGTSQCPDGDTCCKLSSGEWGCCPLPQAVCCSDGVHCCPHGYTCNVANGTCSQGSRRVPIVTKLPASKIKVDVDSVVCPDGQSQCPDGDTCCKLSSGQWGCCPLPQAVCCSDGVHCCPNGYTCDVSAGTCSQGSKHTAILTKLPASKIKVDVDSVVCPDGTSQCPDGDTCCKLSSGEWGCCPLPQAVCCSDGIHCCPHGYTCNVANGTCSRGSKHTAILTKLSASKIKVDVDSVVCPDGTSQCPDGYTCCKLSSGEWGCCPLPQAVCCSDGVHCCPHGYTCNVANGTCSQGSRRVPIVTKLPASKKKPSANVVCPDGQSECPDGNTCCKLSSGQWGCCPLPQAVCCSDGVHCCPHGYTCDVSAGTCSQGSKHTAILTKLPASKIKVDVDSVVCPDGTSQCPDGNTCCKLSSGEWGCCPLPQAVCCSDGVHCCPNGYTCDVTAGTCSQESKTRPILTKLPASKIKVDEESVICPDGTSECPDGNTCCKLSSGEWGCCPLPQAVCCSDGVHCCPHGYTCNVANGTCSQGSRRVPIVTKLPASKKKPSANVVCPDGQSECTDGTTCCKLSSGQWGCCPLPQAVCCSDGVHCCPNGYTCDVSAGTCSQESKTRPILTKLPASKIKVDVDSVVCPDGTSQCPDGDTCCKLSSGEWGCCPLPQAVCCSDGVHCCPHGYTCNVANGTCSQGSRRVPIVTKLPASNKKPSANVVCPDGQSECPDGNTCCKLSSGQWGCCPLPQAVCCSDGVHCCPNGYTCDVSAGTCSQESKHTAILTKLPASKIKVDVESVVCPDGTSQCPDGNTCCKLSSGEWGCCPLPQAVCCSDGVHCCPNGYTCDVSAGTCSQGSKHTAILTKLPASKIKVDVDSVVCPDGASQCPDGSTCCKLSSGQWGCCPLPQAVCCSDGVHCCPNGYTCDVSAGTCSQGSKHSAILTKLSASERKVDLHNVVCPDGESECPDGNTCCKLSSGQWGCCPLPQAVCCSDGVHCCPNGYTCDVSAGTCSQESKTRPILTKLPASKIKVDVDSVVCPDGTSQCPDGYTCCKLSSGEWGCCPLPQAVCCSDGVHCCPHGYTCNVANGTCSQGSRRVPIVTKLPASKKKPSANVVCPDGQSECPDGNTCCKLSSGQWGCCPLPQAVCCSDGVHCCPNGYTCDVSAGTCSQESKTRPILTKLPASKIKVDVDSVVCPDGTSQCPDGDTCCKLSSGEWGCCPLPQAVCCSDGVHCCPHGYTCNVANGTCSQGSRRVPIVTKLPASKKKPSANVVCPDGQSECPDGNTCCKLSSGQWGCCPLPQAVCCSDGVHCCPHGYTCDVSAGTCSQGSKHTAILTKLPASKIKVDVDSVVCPDGTSQCPDGNTCCKLSSGEWGCCPLPQAVCCSDGVHCCPNGYTCDVSAGTCSQESKTRPILTKLPASKIKVDVESVICPDGTSECPDGNTCCKLSSGKWGCCPLPNAVCCSDGKHCCPSGYTCNVSAVTCSKESLSISMFQKVPAVQKTSDERAFDGIVCPDKKYQCAKGSTCCKLPSGAYGCCPLKNAVCCSDNKHCCPEGYTCDVKQGKCNKTAENITMINSIPVTRTSTDAEVKYINCPDGSTCLDYETCCELPDEEYGCCPMPKAVCCSDHEHCCPCGYRCDVAAEMCVTGNVRLPIMQKMKSSRRPKSDHVNLDEKIHFIPRPAQDDDMLDDDAVLWLPRP